MNLESTPSGIDPMVADAITAIRDRFGTEGLRDVINLATAELARVQAAEQELARLSQPREPAAPTDETQAWLAYREADPAPDDNVS